ncbi:NUDIX domain-containing protein [Sphingomicrobium sp. XHP0239]|uniref:NUDIX domain-containing protein n=1 Tax=Sphingomicrobium maritimum TaxID=3133972 RepID=UPI0031CCD472
MTLSKAIPAATLIMVRDGTDGRPETLMVRRTQRMAFAAGAWVWPGGRIDEADAALEWRPEYVAAVREMLEEVGLPVALDPLPDAGLAASLQRKLLGGATLPALIERHGLRLEGELLTPYARWAPELELKRRFDTWFILVRAPGSLPPIIPQESEVAEARWVAPARMLEEIAAGEAHAIFPTMRTLERLATCERIDDLFADAERFPAQKIVPWVEDRDGEEMICIPDTMGFPVTAVPTREAFRGER